jgi:hypothetical protein
MTCAPSCCLGASLSVLEVSLQFAHRAKYIEGLENRLGRMEHLLRLSGKE